METEKRILELENKVAEQEQLIKELFEAAVNQMGFLKDIREQMNELSEAVLTIGKRFV